MSDDEIAVANVLEDNNEPELVKVADMTRTDRKALLNKWRKEIRFEEINPEEFSWWVYTVFAIDELYALLNDITGVMKNE
jgi:tRNA A37 threonylcarbamoyladenosine dehydratase